MKHTHTPWRIFGGMVDGYGITNKNETIIEQHAFNEVNLRRIVECVNACEGINPKAVPELLEACKAMAEYISQQWGDDWENRPNHLRLGEQAIAAAEK